MHINVSHLDKDIKFDLIPFSFIRQNIESIFYNKNNKTLKQTLEHHRYSRFKNLMYSDYSEFLELNLGDFLRLLKEKNDTNYLKFLNKYGDKKYCEFIIDSSLNDKGIYCYIVGDTIKYVGRCTDNLKKRINQGYGKIHPKNCFIDGQATNCHLNFLINSTQNVKFGIFRMNDKSTEEIIKMEKLILSSSTFDWNIQKS